MLTSHHQPINSPRKMQTTNDYQIVPGSFPWKLPAVLLRLGVFTFRLFCGNSLPHDSASQLPSITVPFQIFNEITATSHRKLFQNDSLPMFIHVPYVFLLLVSCMLPQPNTNGATKMTVKDEEQKSSVLVSQGVSCWKSSCVGSLAKSLSNDLRGSRKGRSRMDQNGSKIEPKKTGNFSPCFQRVKFLQMIWKHLNLQLCHFDSLRSWFHT